MSIAVKILSRISLGKCRDAIEKQLEDSQRDRKYRDVIEKQLEDAQRDRQTDTAEMPLNNWKIN